MKAHKLQLNHFPSTFVFTRQKSELPHWWQKTQVQGKGQSLSKVGSYWTGEWSAVISWDHDPSVHPFYNLRIPGQGHRGWRTAEVGHIPACRGRNTPWTGCQSSTGHNHKMPPQFWLQGWDTRRYPQIPGLMGFQCFVPQHGGKDRRAH